MILTNITQTHQTPPNCTNGYIRHLVSDYSRKSLEEALTNEHVVISTVAPGDVCFQKRLIDAAIAAGVRRFIPNEFYFDTLDSTVSDRLPSHKARAEVLEYLKEQAEVNESFSWTAIAAHCILEQGLKKGLLGLDVKWQSAKIYGTGDERFACSTLTDVGHAVEEMLVSGYETATNQYLYRASFVTTQSEILAAFERIMGKNWTNGYADIAECISEGRKRMGMGFLDGAILLLERSILFDGNLNDVDVWKQTVRITDEAERQEALDVAIRGVLSSPERAGNPDCGCG